MTQTFDAVQGIDFTLPASPALTAPPLSLLDLAIDLVDLEGLTDRIRVAVERASSAQERLSELEGQISVAQNALDQAGVLTDEERDQPGAADAVEDAKRFLAQLVSEYGEIGDENLQASALGEDLAKQLAELSRWEHGFVYLPELSNAQALETFAPDTDPAITNPTVTNIKNIGSNQAPGANPFYWSDPWVVVARDDRSLFGWPHTDFASRAQRAQRAIVGHEAWQVEYEFWSGARIPTNYHLSASPNTPLTSPHRTLLVPFPNPMPAPGTTLGVAVGLAQSMAALDQAIAESDAGTGMIHATPYVMQEWMKTYPFIRDPQLVGVYTVNHNLLVPGFGYGGTGPDQVALTGLTITTTAGSNEVTSLTSVFNSNYIGRQITQTAGNAAIPAGTYIVQVVNGNEVILSNAATSSHNVTASVAGTGGRAGGGPQQWAYATEQVYTLKGDVNTYPYDLREGSPLVTVNNSIDVRAERSWSTITNRFLRSAVLIDTTQP